MPPKIQKQEKFNKNKKIRFAPLVLPPENWYNMRVHFKRVYALNDNGS